MPVEKISLGQLVRSKAGRDRGQVYLVVGFAEISLLLLANGRDRKVTKPKKKNIRHISVLKSIDKGVAAKIACDQAATDEEIRHAISAWINTGEE
ncbi:MAG: KOW domain-containing RNA-binding protein [Negativicutes bacterium]|nr:KOW domain-containing RNA-binding protein [Negativicutes bacterium]